MALRVLLVAMSAAVAGLSSPIAASADLFDEIYARAKPFEASLKTLTARFTEESTSSLLNQPLVARGELAVVRPGKVLLRYQEPERRTVRIDGDVMRMVWPARNIDQRIPIGATQRRIQQYFVDKTPAELRGHFDIAAREVTAPANSWLVRMTPKRKQIRQNLSLLELWIDRGTMGLSALQMTFPNGDRKRLSLENVVVNPVIDPALFTLPTR